MKHYRNLDLSDIIYFDNERNELITEQWKDIIGWEGFYKGSSLGRLKSLQRFYFRNGIHKCKVNEKILKQSFDEDGYLLCGLSINNKVISRRVHNILAQVFIPNPENKSQVNHINGIKTDNRVWMLEWNTNAENTKHAYDIGLNISKKGSMSHRSKLSEKDVLEIKELSKHLFQSDIAKIFNVSTGCISMLINKVTYKNQ